MHHSAPGWIVALVGLLAGLAPVVLRADESLSFSQVESLFRQHCYSCHGIEKPKGKLRIDKLDPDIVKGGDRDRWLGVFERLEFGDMPPESAPALKREDRQLMMAWIAKGRQQSGQAKQQIPSFRRLTRHEYERTMQDLLGLPIEFGSRLPEDGKSKDGFRNDGDVLRMSPLQYETLLAIADEALAEAIVSGPPPVVHRYRIMVHEFRVEPLPKPENHPGESFDYVSNPFDIKIMPPLPPPGGGRGFKPPPSPYPPNVLPPSAIVRFREAAVRPPKSSVTLRMHQSFRRGETVVKIRAARIEPEIRESDASESETRESEKNADSSRVPILTVAMGSSNFHGVELKTVGEPTAIDHTDLRTYEIRFRMENVSVPNPGPLNNKNSTILAVWNSAQEIDGESQPPLLNIESIEFESPFYETWPPKTHTDILFANDGLDEKTYAREVLGRFATRAFRTPLAAAELDQLVNYWTQARENTDSLEASLRETLSVVLSSPRFLGLPAAGAGGAKAKLTDHELASRLSYFLWSTMPDEQLLQLAGDGTLHEPAELSAQVRRMIQHRRASSFIEQFTEQWLELDRLKRVVVHTDSYPGFDDQLAAAMRLETIHFFGEVLRGDMSIFQFLNSDFTCVNDVLAAHYGISGVTGPTFRKVKLDANLHRGGILTHAGILTGLSDGKDGHPIKRGVWVLRNLLDDPPPPPPPNVPELNRETPELKNLTIPQALEVHRNSAACMGCHRKIDPWGIAFEEYDAVGNWQRDGRGAALREKRTEQPIDSETELPGGVKISGLVDLRDELARSKADEFRRAMIRKLMAYALGRRLSPGDAATADALVPALRAREDRLAALIELIVASEPFQAK
jgi:mono/diheme cytochrome c family protein